MRTAIIVLLVCVASTFAQTLDLSALLGNLVQSALAQLLASLGGKRNINEIPILQARIQEQLSTLLTHGSDLLSNLTNLFLSTIVSNLDLSSLSGLLSVVGK